MTRADIIRTWDEILRLEATGHPPDRSRALDLVAELATALDGKVLLLDDGTALYEYSDGSVVTSEIFLDEI